MSSRPRWRSRCSRRPTTWTHKSEGLLRRRSLSSSSLICPAAGACRSLSRQFLAPPAVWPPALAGARSSLILRPTAPPTPRVDVRYAITIIHVGFSTSCRLFHKPCAFAAAPSALPPPAHRGLPTCAERRPPARVPPRLLGTRLRVRKSRSPRGSTCDARRRVSRDRPGRAASEASEGAHRLHLKDNKSFPFSHPSRYPINAIVRR